MAEPPKSGPHSDLTGVNRDMRIQKPAEEEHPNAGAIQGKNEQTTARPEETPPIKE